MNNLDKQYQELLSTILIHGVVKQDRTETGTKSIFGYTIRHNMQDGFPLLTTKKMAFKTMVTELLWFLKGDTNIKYLVDNGCNIWNGDAYKKYLTDYTDDCEYKVAYFDRETKVRPYTLEEFVDTIKSNPQFAEEYGELGPIYGKQWRDWGVRNDGSYDSSIDQISNLIHELKTNPDSRRLMVNAWNVGELNNMVLPPCHYGFQVYTRKLTRDEKMAAYEKAGYIKNIDPLDWAPDRAISLMWNQRSVDTFLGLPFNIASYGLLLEMIAKEVNMVPDQLIGNLGDTHLYLNHLDQAEEQIRREPFELPSVQIEELNLLEGGAEIELKNYLHHPAIKAPLSN